MNDPLNPVVGDTFELPISKYPYRILNVDDLTWIEVGFPDGTTLRWTAAEIAKHAPYKGTMP